MSGANEVYDQDLYAWAMKNAELIREGRFSEIDAEHIAEELEEMGVSSKRELTNRLGVLLAHLLKWQKQPAQRSSSWSGTIKEQRRKIERLLEQSPSLRREIETRIADAYGDALALVERDTGMEETYFPAACPFSLEQILARDFWPQ